MIDGSPIVDNDGVHYYGEKEGAVELSSGRHHFESVKVKDTRWSTCLNVQRVVGAGLCSAYLPSTMSCS